jgi:hypothetical protein
MKVAASMNSRHTPMLIHGVRRQVGDLGVARDLRQQQEQEVDRDAGEVRQHEDRRDHESPPGHPADPRAERARRPGEAGAGIRHAVVQLAPKATSSIGMKPTRMIAGICAPTADAVGPTAAVNVYAGAMHEMPMTTAPMRPIVPALSPLLERASVVEAASVAEGVLIVESPRSGFGDDDHRHGDLVQHLGRGRAEEQAPRLREAARADEHDLTRQSR